MKYQTLPAGHDLVSLLLLKVLTQKLLFISFPVNVVSMCKFKSVESSVFEFVFSKSCSLHPSCQLSGHPDNVFGKPYVPFGQTIQQYNTVSRLNKKTTVIMRMRA